MKKKVKKEIKKEKCPFLDFFKSEFFKHSAKRFFLMLGLLWLEAQIIFYFVDNSQGISQVIYGLKDFINIVFHSMAMFNVGYGFINFWRNTEWGFIIAVLVIFLFLARKKFLTAGDLFKNARIVNVYPLLVNMSLMSLFIFVSKYLSALTVQLNPSIILSILFWCIFIVYFISFLFIFHPKKLILRFKNEIFYTFALFLVLYFMINATYTPVLRQLWIKTLAPVQGAILSSLVKFFDSTVAYKMQADSFVISSGAGKLIVKFFCSGFDGLTLFLIIFSILTIYDWNAINKRKLIPIYLSGIILMFFANILRLFLLTVWTLYIPDKLYFDFFHANVGWIIYAIVLGLFEYFTYNWLRR